MSLNKNHNYDIAIIGLGYVGLTLGTVLAQTGLKVLGLEKRKDVVDLVNSGKAHFSENGLNDALSRVVKSSNLIAKSSFAETDQAQTYIITVGTPLNQDGVARLDMIESATNQVAAHMRNDALIILRSTVKIGTTRNIVSPILQDSGKSFHIAMCPERTLEGRALQELRELPQIVGADSQESRDRASAIFQRLTKSVIQVSSYESAEIVKLVDNTYRDVQFAFANEVARACEAHNVNAQEVIASGKLGYARTNVPLPGLVGGPCLEKDPHIFTQSVRNLGIDLEITQAARLVNERQPYETVKFITSEMARRQLGEGVKLTILGMAFKGIPSTDDLRGSMSLQILNALREARPDLQICAYDSVSDLNDLEQFTDISIQKYNQLEHAVEGSAVVIIANNHPELGKIPPLSLIKSMQENSFIYDYWNHFSNLTKQELGKHYFAVGNTNQG